MRNIWFFAASLVLVMSTIGCGRQGSVASARKGTTLPAIGDTADYSIDSDVNAGVPDGHVPQIVGSRKYTVVESPGHGRSVPSYVTRTLDLREEIVQQLGGLSKSRVVISWLGIDASGNVYLLGEALDGVNWEVVSDTNPPVYMPAEVKPGSSWQYVAHFAGGNTESCVNNCVGSEAIITPSGTFQSLKVSYDASRTGVNGADVRMSGHRWLGAGLPYVFEVRNEYGGKFTLGGIPVDTRTVESLQAFRLAP